jgi:hypothetical protein
VNLDQLPGSLARPEAFDLDLAGEAARRLALGSLDCRPIDGDGHHSLEAAFLTDLGHLIHPSRRETTRRHTTASH